ncbi:MAG TPA: SUMF1/EgtB/PvdO family nonheme iron enzyme, partial [archaeon]|nr:SUMF1/EgtB/PvdO family nonheme iron enzyme [archaeon]
MMKVLIKKILFLGIVCLLATCDKDRLPTEPETAQGQIVIVFEDDMPGPGLSAARPDSLSKTLTQKEKAGQGPRLSAVDQLEVRVLQSDNTQIASQTSTVSDGRFKGSITVTAQNNLKVLLTGKNSGVIERFAMDSDVDVFAGQTTTVTISTSEWSAGYIPKITGISPNPSPDGSYRVSWGRVTGATGYVLQEAANTNFTGASTAYSGSNTYASISGKSQGTYYYRVQATNEYNVRSGWSESQSVLVSISVPTLIDPGSSVSSGESYYVSWNSVSEAVSYTLEEATNTLFSEATSHTVTDTSYKFSHSVSSTTTYYYRLKTNTATGSSGWSSTVDMIVNSISITMVSIPEGIFQMGSNTGLDTEKPVHMVTLTAFEMSEYEITQAQYEAITGVNPSYFTGDYNHPVENVSWYDAVTFCNKLSETEGLEPCYDLSTWECDFSKNGYRLPTEAEWEYAARAGTSTNYYTGNSESELDRAGWYSGNSGNTTHPVGGKENNAFGLYDMHGNVWELCNDWYSSIYYSQSPGWNPAGPQTGASRAARGGCWGYGADYSRSASRGSNRPDGKDLYIGFRVVRGSFVPGIYIEIPLLNDPGVSVLSGESYTLSWSSVSGANSYTIEEATDSSFTGVSTQTVTGTSQSFSHSVSSATTYYYRVKTNTATGSSGWSNAEDIIVNTLGVPAVSDPGISVASGAGYTVSWSSVTGAVSYTIEEATNSSFSGATSQTVSGTSQSFSRIVSTATTYYYRVKANNAYGSSGWSNTVDIIVNPPPPGTPVATDPGTSVASGASYTVSWSSVTGSASYTIEEATNSSFSGSSSQTVSGTSQSFSHNVSAATTYYYRVKANSAYGSSDWSNTVDMLVNPPPPGAPVATDPGSSVASGESYTVSWSSVTGAASYTIEEATNSSFSGATSQTVNTTSQSFSRSVSTITTYYYRVKANNAYGSSGWSNVVDIIVNPLPPGTPVATDPGSSVASGAGYTVSWSSVTGAFSYTIEEATNSSFSVVTSQTVSSTSQSFSHNVSAATTYYYRVKANSASGSSGWSNTVDMVVNLPAIAITLVTIPAGTFQMGSSTGNSDEQPVHTVTLTAFQISKYETTQAQYQEVMGTNPAYFTGDDNRPVEQVSWYDAVTFCNKLSESEGLEQCYNLSTWECDFTKDGYRLPTEAEWEYACRAGTTSNYYTGDNDSDLDKAGWYYGNSGSATHAVGGKQANSFGLYDMHGNVWEWCNDWYGSYGSASQTNPTGSSSGSYRVIRGGGWNISAGGCRSAVRDVNGPPDRVADHLGFRVVRGSFVPGNLPAIPNLNDPGSSVASVAGYTVSWSSVTGTTSYTIEEATNSSFTGATSQTVSGTSQSFSHNVSTAATYYYRVKANSAYGSSGWSNTVDMVVNPPAIEIILVSIPAGTFQMGSNSGESNEQPVHTVTLSTFQMSKYETTQGQYQAIIGTNPSYFTGDDNLPVEQTSWYDAVTFCNKLSEAKGLEPCYNLDTWDCDFTKNGFRLPTEAEWEYACRAGTTTNYYTGDSESDLGRAGWYDRNSGYTPHAGGQKEANAFGLYDMHGNIQEWCNDWFDSNYYSNSSSQDPTGPATGSSKVLRGHNWLGTAYYCRSAFRDRTSPDVTGIFMGFRVVRGSFVPGNLPYIPNLNDPGSSVASGYGYSVSWSSVTGATSYTIEEATNSSFSGATSQTVSSTSQIFIHSVSETTYYYYRVKANNASGSSGWSNTVYISVYPLVVLIDPGPQVIILGQELRLTLQVEYTSDRNLIYIMLIAPGPEATINEKTGEFYWMPSALGNYVCIFKVSDGLSVDSISVEIVVLSITLVSIPAGTFQMGQVGVAEPVHSVTLSAFQMSKYEITQAQYKSVMGANPSYFTGDDNRPVETVRWYDAVTFCNKLSEFAGLHPCYNLSTWTCDFTKNGYRLPTEAEWEYACRAGTSTNYYTGDSESDLDRAGWYYYNSGGITHAIGGKQANAFGLYDMHGNVWEWC